MKHNENIPGWASDIYAWQEWAQSYIPPGGTYLEVGTFFGASLAHMGHLRPDINLIAIDPWLDSPSQGYHGAGEYQAIQDAHGGLFLTFLHFMMTEAPDVLKRTRVIRGTANSVRVVGDVDVLFVDGAHDYWSVVRDIEVFAPLVRPGGLVSGHDYPDPDVTRAVREAYGDRTRVGYPDGPSDCLCWWVEQR